MQDQNGEIVLYRSIMLRRYNIEALEKIKSKTGISITRLVNLAIKSFIDEYKKNRNVWQDIPIFIFFTFFVEIIHKLYIYYYNI